MRTRSILAAVTLTAAILIGGTGTAAAQSQPLPNGRCLVSWLTLNLNAAHVLAVIGATSIPEVDPCAVAVDSSNPQ